MDIFPNTWFEPHSQYINTTLSCLENNLWLPSWCRLKRNISLYLRHKTLSPALDQHDIPTEIQWTTCKKYSCQLCGRLAGTSYFGFWNKLLCSLGWLWAPNVAKADSKLFFCLFIQCWGYTDLGLCFYSTSFDIILFTNVQLKELDVSRNFKTMWAWSST